MKKPRQVVHLIETLNCGGTENNLLRMLPELEKTGWHNIVVTLGGGGEMLPRFREAGVEVRVLNQGNFLSYRTLATLAKTLKEIQPDIVVTNLIRADILGRVFLPLLVPYPIISYLHTTYNHPRYQIARLFEWLTKPLARHYIANSVAVRDFYQTKLGVGASKLSVVEGGIDIDIFEQADETSVRRELKLPSQALVVTCVGNLAPNKGQASLIESFEIAFGNNPNAYLLLVGEGENRPTLEALRQKSRAAKRIHLLGRRTDVARILKLTDIFALPTLFEGLSVALLEAMAAGVAIITTNIPENRVILTDQTTAWLVPPADTETLAKALSALGKDPKRRAELGSSALKHVRQHYSMASFAPKFAEVLVAQCQPK